MRHVLFQPWICVEGAANVNSFQSTAKHVDIEPYDALVPYVEISNISGTGFSLILQTVPTFDTGYGMSLVDAAGNNAAYSTSGVQTLRIFRFNDAQTPPAKYLRWFARGGSTAWSVTFRISLGLREAGGQRYAARG